MTKKTSLLLGLLAFVGIPISLASYEVAISIRAENVINLFNNFELDYDGDRYIVHHEPGYGDVLEGEQLTLVIQGDLDDARDTLRKGDYKRCDIDQADPFDEKYTVDEINVTRTYTEIVAKNGNPWRIFFSEECDAIRNMAGLDVYIDHYGDRILSAGDNLILPSNAGHCIITHVQDMSLEDVSSVEPDPYEGLDVKRPTTPTSFRAIPTRDAVYLYWDEAEDAGGISHYIISASLYHVEDARARDPDDPRPEHMPNQIPTTNNDTNIKLENLESDELYFFRVIAVDNEGNLSSYWSEEARAMTRSSIAERDLTIAPVDLKLIQEDNAQFYFEWTEPVSTRRRIITLDIDGDRVYSNTEWPYRHVRILKTPSRKGKEMTLTVYTRDFRGTANQKTVEKFSF